MQGQSQRGGLRGGRRGFGGPTGGGGNKQDKQNKPDQSADVAIGPGGMTPGPGPGGTMVAGATPPGLGQSVAQGGTTAGFAGQPSPGSGAAQSLQDLFAAQQPPEGIATLTTLPPDQELMDFVNQLKPNLNQPTTFQNFVDIFGFPPMDPLDENPSYESGETVIDNLNSLINTFENLNKFKTPMGIVEVDIDPFARSFKITKPFGAD